MSEIFWLWRFLTAFTWNIFILYFLYFFMWKIISSLIINIFCLWRFLKAFIWNIFILYFLYFFMWKINSLLYIKFSSKKVHRVWNDNVKWRWLYFTIWIIFDSKFLNLRQVEEAPVHQGVQVGQGLLKFIILNRCRTRKKSSLQDWAGCFWPVPSVVYSTQYRRARLHIFRNILTEFRSKFSLFF